MKKIKVKKFYNELNEISDSSKDYIVATMPIHLWTEVLIALYMKSLTDKTFKSLYEVLDKETQNGECEWYK